MGKSYKKILENREYLQKKELSNGITIFTVRGKKGPNDFRVRAYNSKTQSGLQPKHAHFAIDFYGKLCANKEKALNVLMAIIEVWHGKSIEETLLKYKEKCEGLPGYDLEYILYAMKWILEQEDINFGGRLPEKQKELDEICRKQNVATPKGREGSQLAIALLCDIANGTHPVEAFRKAGLKI
jgi:hypothetical protein